MGLSSSNFSDEQSISGNVRVMPGHWGIGERSDVLYTRDVGACIGIAIHDTLLSIGHMAHIFSTYSSQKELLGPFVDSVRQHSSDLSGLTGWVIGGTSEANVSKSIRQDLLLRIKVISHLSEMGLEPKNNLCVDWNNNEGLLVSMSLSCATGKFDTQNKSII